MKRQSRESAGQGARPARRRPASGGPKPGPARAVAAGRSAPNSKASSPERSSACAAPSSSIRACIAAPVVVSRIELTASANAACSRSNRAFDSAIRTSMSSDEAAVSAAVGAAPTRGAPPPV
eukprot:8435981-Lingulodinium_polyedra.AAC.1